MLDGVPRLQDGLLTPNCTIVPPMDPREPRLEERKRSNGEMDRTMI